MNFSFYCPTCSRSNNATEEHIGHRVTCPGCGTALIVPEPSLEINLGALIIAVIGALFLIGFAALFIEWWLLCAPVGILFLILALPLSIHRATRLAAVVATVFGVGGFALTWAVVHPGNEFAIMVAVTLQAVLLALGLFVLVLFLVALVIAGK